MNERLDLARIKNEMAAQGVTQRTVSFLLNVHEGTANRKINGTSVWSFDDVVKVCDLLRLPISEVVKR